MNTYRYEAHLKVSICFSDQVGSYVFHSYRFSNVLERWKAVGSGVAGSQVETAGKENASALCKVKIVAAVELPWQFGHMLTM